MSESSVGEVIKADAGGVECRRVGIAALLDAPRAIKGEHFLRLRPDGGVPVVVPPRKEPEISAEELHARRMEQMEREIYQRVFAAAEAAGLKAGEERMEREIHAMLPRLEGVVANLEQLHARILAGAERYLVETTLVLVRELIATELTIHPELVAERVKRILSRAVGRKGIVIHVSPGNARILERIRAFGNLRIEADPGLSSGAVHLESDFGGLEDNLEIQLKEVELAMREYLQERLEALDVPDIAERARASAEIAKGKEARPLLPDPGSKPSCPLPVPVVPVSLAAEGPAVVRAGKGLAVPDIEEELAASDVEEALEVFDLEEGLAASDVEESLADSGDEDVLADSLTKQEAWEAQGAEGWSEEELDLENRVEELAIDELFKEES
ncbi:MAG: flagellar assembly protein FliH [Magnetococcus sp. YQC-9]